MGGGGWVPIMRAYVRTSVYYVCRPVLATAFENNIFLTFLKVDWEMCYNLRYSCPDIGQFCLGERTAVASSGFFKCLEYPLKYVAGYHGKGCFLFCC